MKNKIAVIIGARGIGDLIYHLPLLKSLHQSYNEKLIIFSNRANKAKEVFKDEKFFKKIIYIDNHRYNPLVTIINSFKFKSFLNSYKIERIILTSNAKRLILPVLMSNAKIKNFFGTGKFLLTKDKKNDHLTVSERLLKYTAELDLPKKIWSFNLTINSQNIENKKNIFISVDSHHDQNNWGLVNYLKIINALKKDHKIFLNFSPNKKEILKFFLDRKIFFKNIVFTHKKNISQIIEIIKKCQYVVGNESGPVCLGASFRKKVHAIYLPIHTKPESKIIFKKNKYYNASKIKPNFIIKKIINSIKLN
jgi:ADP-heptose:LPS heptosyltransferase